MNINFTNAEISADVFFPMEIYFCLLYSERDMDNPYSIMPKHPFRSGWGIGAGKQISNTGNGPFSWMEVAWLSLTEGIFYYGQFNLNKEIACILKDDEADNFHNLIIGLAPRGKIALWANNEYSSKLVGICKAKEISLSIAEFLEYDYKGSVDQYCKQALEGEESYIGRGDDFKKRMKQFCYRFSIKTYDGDVIPTETIQVLYSDGSYNRANDKSLNFRFASIPEKLNIRFILGKRNYLCGIFLIRSKLFDVFERFYSAHPETKTDFIIRIDAENKKYELALYRQGLKEPVIIPESAYEMIVFKNKFEHYRSENYNQPRGAWIW